MATTEGIGGVLSASAALPATFDEAGYEALTWDEVSEVTEIPEYGPEHAVVTHTPLKTGIVNKFHGELNYGSISVPMALDLSDAGQLILRTALKDREEIAFQIEFSDGSVDYISGKVMSFTKGASVGNVVPATSLIEFTRPNVEVPAT